MAIQRLVHSKNTDVHKNLFSSDYRAVYADIQGHLPLNENYKLSNNDMYL